DRWHLMGVMLSAAGSLQWYHDKFAHDKSFGELVDEASQVPAGSEGLIFLPYLSGERTPHPDPFARGAWIGLTTRHDRPHLTRALLAGVGAGVWPDVDTACAQTIFVSDRVSPNPATSATYRWAYHEYQSLYPV